MQKEKSRKAKLSKLGSDEEGEKNTN